MDMLVTDGDIVFTDDLDLALVTGQAAIGQDIRMRIQTWLGESIYDVNFGTPFLQVIFKGSPNLLATQFIIEQIVLATPGGIDAEIDFPEFDSQTREAEITGRATTIDGNVDFSVLIG